MVVTISKATVCRYLLRNLRTLHYSGAVAPTVAPHDTPKEDTGGGTTSGLHQMRLFVQIQAHRVKYENAPRVLHLAVIR
jgi:hypothetical protein